MQLTFSVYRYNPEVDNSPRMQDYTLEVEEGQDMMVLDALILLKEQDPTLSFRRSCREGVCGSDGMNMNGKMAWRVSLRCQHWAQVKWLFARCLVCRLCVTWWSI